MNLSITRVETAPVPQRQSAHQQSRLIFLPEDVTGNTPFLVLVEDWFSPPAGFPTHPHRGMETVTFVLDGEVNHQDHAGGAGRLQTGDVGFMTAGGGVLHSEMPGSAGAHLLQLWLNLPARLKRVPARYNDVHVADAPVHREAGVEVRVYAGKVNKAAMPHGTTWPLMLVDIHLEAGHSFSLPIPKGMRSFVYALNGSALIGAGKNAVEQGDVAWSELSGPDEISQLLLEAQTQARLLVYASLPINEPIVMSGPFVMNTTQEIQQAHADYRAGRLTILSMPPA